MNIAVSYEQGRVPVTVLHVKGDLTGNEHEELQTKAQEAFEAGTHNLLLNLKDVPHISSRGLRALHYIYMLSRTDTPEESNEAVTAGIRAGTYTSPHFKLLKPSKDVTKVLSMAGYDMFLEIHQNLKDAIASF